MTLFETKVERREMSIYNKKRLFFISFLFIIVCSNLALGQEMKETIPENPKVLKAIAPLFIPFVFGETGVAEAVIQVKINKEGKVTSAQTKSVTLFKDLSFEETAKKWLFENDSSKEERIVEIKFILRIMPKGTSKSEITEVV